ncbi:MAG: DegT/DnrJ/EryC1/StrS family aminotransferase, partial [Alphaproteobacteria bacterium]|nr:DegT/DnrJ/EryC1/StrS family aminotransferase [Alphaproteobacteria bacterium]
EVVFSDVDPVTGLMGPEHLEEALSRCGGLKPRAVFPVHLKGLGVDLRGLREVADRHGLSVVADSCHAIGGSVNGKPVGAGFYEDLSTFSFHPVKTIATGEGGAVTTNDPEKAALMKRLRHHGMIFTPDKGPWMYEMPDLGFNHRMTDIQCALGVSQLKKLPAFVARRRALADLYDGFLEPLASLVNIPARNGYSDPAWHLYAVQIDFEKAGMGRAALMSALKDKGIGTQVHYIPVHQQPYYKKRYGDIALPGAEAYYARTLSLPLYPSMSDENAAYVVEELKTILRI